MSTSPLLDAIHAVTDLLRSERYPEAATALELALERCVPLPADADRRALRKLTEAYEQCVALADAGHRRLLDEVADAATSGRAHGAYRRNGSGG